MRTRSARLALPLAALIAGTTAAQTPSWSPDWAVAGLGGTVAAFADYNGELFAGGEWFAAKGGLIRGLARFDGLDWRPVGTGIDLVAYSFPPADTQIAAMVEWNGELVFAGTFDRVDGQPIGYVARWDGTQFRPLGSGLALSFDEAEVRALAVHNNELFAAGLFDTADGQPANGIARWNGSSWAPLGGGLRDNGGSVVGYPRTLHVHNGQLIVGGSFDRAGNVVVANIAAWDGVQWSALGGGSNGPVWSMTTHNNLLVASGEFTVGAAIARPAAWNGSSWSMLGTNQPGFAPFVVRTFGTELFAAAGQSLLRLTNGAWQAVGAVTNAFNGFNGPAIYALHPYGAELIVGGQFTRAGSTPTVMQIAGSGAVAFDGVSQWRTLGTGQGLDRRVRRLLPWRGGRVAAGPFGDAGAVPATGLAFHDGDRWNELARLTGGSGPTVNDCAVWQGDLIVSGTFTHVNGQPFPGIARFDGTTWHPFGGTAPTGLYVHGGELFGYGGTALQRWNGFSFAAVATPPTGFVDEVHTHADGFLYALNNDATNHRVLRWNGTQLQAIGAANDFVHAIGSHGSHLVLGGRFTSVSGVPANLIARWNGTSWASMPAVSGYSANAFAELDGDLYLGINGDPRGFFLRLRNGVWSPLGGATDTLPVRLFVDRATASVFGSGDFFAVASLPARSFAEWRNQPDWQNRLHGLPTANGAPLLAGRGAVVGGQPILWGLDAPANSLAVLVLGLQRVDLPLFGGTLIPSPDVLLGLVTDAQGLALHALTLTPGMLPGIDVWSQAWVLDASGPAGFAASNALQCTTR